jgi:uncharacterized protein
MPELHEPVPDPGGYGYDIQFILQGQGLDLTRIRDTISTLGDSVLVVGDTQTIKVHLHSPDPGRPLTYAAGGGSLSHIIIENLQDQYRDFVHNKAIAGTATQNGARIGIVAVARGEGLIQVLQSLGANSVVPGGQTMNPSTKELLQAIESQSGTDVIVLPNNPNVILTARQAQSLSSKRVEVIPTRTIPEGISALLALNYQADLETNAGIMLEAAKHIRTGEVTTAVRGVQINGLQVNAGETIGLLNGELVTSGEGAETVIANLLRLMQADQAEIITVYYGEDAPGEAAQQMASRIQQWYPGQQVELLRGDQPHYNYILSAE